MISTVMKVHVNSFEIDTCSVTNDQFSKFIKETKYVTEADQFRWSFVWSYVVSNEVYSLHVFLPSNLYFVDN